ncbi:tail fiber assembly protein [Sodalis sp. (in: enterobacteria)]|uniref:tail fiber assembly protein n=1 Tax=Sodalis sp. (in: enterobacteria) TaxID=1898979 RepID=UPI003F685BF4
MVSLGSTTPPRKKTAEINDAQLKKNRLDKDAQRIIQLLEYAIETDIRTGEESAQFHAWKKYRVLLNRVDVNQVSDILWPEMPQQGA